MNIQFRTTSAGSSILAVGLCLMFATLLQLPAFAQSVQIGNTTAALTSIRSDNGKIVATEWAAFAKHQKTMALLNWAAAELGCTPVPVPQEGFTTTEFLRFNRAGAPVSADFEVRQTVVPVRCNSLRYSGATAALILNRYVATPSLAYPRLLVRFGNNGYMVEEYSLRKDTRVTKMTCKFGDCVFRTSLRILEQRNGPVYRSLMNAFENSAKEPVFNTLRRLYDVRTAPVGQKELALYSGILVSSNLEEEWDSGVITGTLDQNFKPERNDSWIVAEAKKQAKELIKDLLKEAGKVLWEAIKKWLGL